MLKTVNSVNEVNTVCQYIRQRAIHRSAHSSIICNDITQGLTGVMHGTFM